MTRPLPHAEKTARADARAAVHLITLAERAATEICTIQDLDAAFTELEPGVALTYWRGENLARACEDWKQDLLKESRPMRTRRVRDWAALKQQFKLGFLAQEKFKGTPHHIYDYRITKAKESRR